MSLIKLEITIRFLAFHFKIFCEGNEVPLSVKTFMVQSLLNFEFVELYISFVKLRGDFRTTGFNTSRDLPCKDRSLGTKLLIW